MLPLPFRTSTETFQVGGSFSALRRAALRVVGGGARDDGEGRADRDDHGERRGERGDAPGRVAVQRPGRDREPGELARLAPVDLERRRVEQERERRALAGREAVEAAGLEPGHLLGRELRQLRRVLERQLAAQARSRQAASGRSLARAEGRMPWRSSRFFGREAVPPHVIGEIDVAWRPEVVARNEQRLEGARSLVGNPLPDRPREQHRVPAVAAVARGQHLGTRRAPGLDHAVDRGRREVRDRPRGRRRPLRPPGPGRRGRTAATLQARAPSRRSARRGRRSRARGRPERRRHRLPRSPGRSPARGGAGAFAWASRTGTRPRPQARPRRSRRENYVQPASARRCTCTLAT